jgi:glutathione S-transferase
MSDTYELIYWPGLPGRGEFVRLAFEESGTAYADLGLTHPRAEPVLEQTDSKNLGDATSPPPLAPPILRHTDANGSSLLISQTSNILLYIGARLGLAPSPGEPGSFIINGLVLTALDGLCNETHDTHHPVATGKYYDDQKEVAKLRAQDYRENRLPKFLGYFERVLKGDASGDGPWLYGGNLTVADLVLFQARGPICAWFHFAYRLTYIQCIDGNKHAFPKAMARLEKSGEYKSVFALWRAVQTRPRIKSYLESDRRQSYGDGIYRHYPELDG